MPSSPLPNSQNNPVLKKPNGTVRSNELNGSFIADAERLKSRFDKLRMKQREMARKAGYSLGAVNAALQGTGGDGLRPDLERLSRREFAEIARFIADVLEGVA